MAKLKGDVTRLPRWAQDYVKDLVRERENAVSILNEFQDDQMPSNVFFEKHACTGEVPGTNAPVTKKCYVSTRHLTFLVGKREVYVSLHEDQGHFYLDVSAGFASLRFQPQASNSIRIEEPTR